MKQSDDPDLARAVERGQQRAGLKSPLRYGIVVLEVVAAFLVGGLASRAMAGFVVFVASIALGIDVTYR